MSASQLCNVLNILILNRKHNPDAIEEVELRSQIKQLTALRASEAALGHSVEQLDKALDAIQNQELRLRSVAATVTNYLTIKVGVVDNYDYCDGVDDDNCDGVGGDDGDNCDYCDGVDDDNCDGCDDDDDFDCWYVVAYSWRGWLCTREKCGSVCVCVWDTCACSSV